MIGQASAGFRMDEEAERSFTRRELGLAVRSDVRGIVSANDHALAAEAGVLALRIAQVKLLFRAENLSRQFDREFAAACRTWNYLRGESGGRRQWRRRASGWSSRSSRSPRT